MEVCNKSIDNPDERDGMKNNTNAPTIDRQDIIRREENIRITNNINKALMVFNQAEEEKQDLRRNQKLYEEVAVMLEDLFARNELPPERIDFLITVRKRLKGDSIK